MNNNFIIGTFYTSNTPYEKVFNDYALKSLMRMKQEFNIDWRVSVQENRGSWRLNVAQKAKAILEMLLTLKESNDTRNLVFIDADTTIAEYPGLFNEITADIAYHSLDWTTWYNRPQDTIKELLTGTMFFKNTEEIRDLCAYWYECSVLIDNWEQKVLQELLESPHRSHIVKAELPLEYCYIETMPDGKPPFVKVDKPVIIHHQMSRKLKRLINKEQ